MAGIIIVLLCVINSWSNSEKNG